MNKCRRWKHHKYSNFSFFFLFHLFSISTLYFHWCVLFCENLSLKLAQNKMSKQKHYVDEKSIELMYKYFNAFKTNRRRLLMSQNKISRVPILIFVSIRIVWFTPREKLNKRELINQLNKWMNAKWWMNKRNIFFFYCFSFSDNTDWNIRVFSSFLCVCTHFDLLSKSFLKRKSLNEILFVYFALSLIIKSIQWQICILESHLKSFDCLNEKWAWNSFKSHLLIRRFQTTKASRKKAIWKYRIPYRVRFFKSCNNFLTVVTSILLVASTSPVFEG